MICVFFHSISNNIFTGINRAGVSCEYDTYLILLNMYVQVFLFASMVCCVVWSGGISSVSPVIELSYFLLLDFPIRMFPIICKFNIHRPSYYSTLGICVVSAL